MSSQSLRRRESCFADSDLSLWKGKAQRISQYRLSFDSRTFETDLRLTSCKSRINIKMKATLVFLVAVLALLSSPTSAQGKNTVRV